MGGMTKQLVLADRKARRPGRSATATRGPRYRGALSCRTLYDSSAFTKVIWAYRECFLTPANIFDTPPPLRFAYNGRYGVVFYVSDRLFRGRRGRSLTRRGATTASWAVALVSAEHL